MVNSIAFKKKLIDEIENIQRVMNDDVSTSTSDAKGINVNLDFILDKIGEEIEIKGGGNTVQRKSISKESSVLSASGVMTEPRVKAMILVLIAIVGITVGVRNFKTVDKFVEGVCSAAVMGPLKHYVTVMVSGTTEFKEPSRSTSSSIIGALGVYVNNIMNSFIEYIRSYPSILVNLFYRFASYFQSSEKIAAAPETGSYLKHMGLQIFDRIPLVRTITNIVVENTKAAKIIFGMGYLTGGKRRTIKRH